MFAPDAVEGRRGAIACPQAIHHASARRTNDAELKSKTRMDEE
jgi:hypothetical protein